MLPTLATSGEVVFEESLTVRVFPRPFKRGELIVFTSPLDPSRVVCKRILGLPGDTICVDPTGEYADSTEHVVVPKGHLWVIGDNASMSYDSRHYGPLPSALVRGRLRARVSSSIPCTTFLLSLHRIVVPIQHCDYTPSRCNRYSGGIIRNTVDVI